jgi:RNA recognition motif-containing protein
MNIYVGNLPYSVKSRELREAFEAYGTVTSAEVIIDRRTKRSRGYGFVEMDNEQDGRRAIQELNGRDFMGRELRVDESQPRDQKPERRPERDSERTGERPRAPVVATAGGGGGIVGFFKRLLG